MPDGYPSECNQEERSKTVRETQGGLQGTPKRRAATPGMRGSPNRSDILRDMARRAQPIISEVERRKDSWFRDAFMEEESEQQKQAPRNA